MKIFRVIVLALLVFFTLLGSAFVVNPGERGVRVTLGSMSDKPVRPGVGLKWPWISSVQKVNVQQSTSELEADCFSADLQQVQIKVRVLYRIPEESAVQIVRDYAGDPFDSLVSPRVQEALKEVTASKTAQEIVKSREQIKQTSLEASQKKVGAVLVIADLVIENVKLSAELEKAIEAKMVQQQEAEQAVYREKQAETEALIAVAKAKGEAESIRIQGEALEKTPRLIELKTVEKWDGVAPQVVSSGAGAANILLPITPQDRRGNGSAEPAAKPASSAAPSGAEK